MSCFGGSTCCFDSDTGDFGGSDSDWVCWVYRGWRIYRC
jgi:hypothetical protein